jgi:hypothetical protein
MSTTDAPERSTRLDHREGVRAGVSRGVLHLSATCKYTGTPYARRLRSSHQHFLRCPRQDSNLRPTA